MRFFITITKKGFVIFLALLIILLLISAKAISVKYTKIDGSTHQKRDLFIRKLGYEYNPINITKKDITIPTEFNNVYSNYNKLQKEAGFNLEDYKGKKAVVYSYPLISGEKLLNIIVYKGEIIGGDICETAFDGEMLPLKN